MLDPSEILTRLDGISRGTVLQQYGCSRDRLRRAVAGGTIVRVRAGIFAVPTADAKVVAAAAHGGALTCAAALRAYAVWTLPEDDGAIHVWLGGSGRVHPHEGCACVAHYSPGTAGLGIAPLAVGLIHSYRCLGAEAFFAAYESAWNRRQLSAHDRKRIRRELPASARWLVDLARPDAQSGLESILRLRLHLLGIRLDCQVAISGVGRVDFVIESRVILEVDGRLNHASAERRHHDLRRDAAASALGYETLRFDYALLIHDWDAVLAAILPALARARA
ncbi:endonuclease domain-containing protein [Microbacterium sp. NPDC089695]|uniref:endonuclease domain-containing protein n=1 Tax=Microbacterium sp. NPDC089695 TaxID=3364198 RepID=UPI00381BC9C1